MTVNNTVPFMAKKKVEKRKFIEGIFNLQIFLFNIKHCKKFFFMSNSIRLLPINPNPPVTTAFFCIKIFYINEKSKFKKAFVAVFDLIHMDPEIYKLASDKKMLNIYKQRNFQKCN